jgi:hypothetical protein
VIHIQRLLEQGGDANLHEALAMWRGPALAGRVQAKNLAAFGSQEKGSSGNRLSAALFLDDGD